MTSVVAPERGLDVLASVDVLVAGGGVAGCSAAIAAARAGAQTMLVERNGCLGGVLTSNIIPNFVGGLRDEENRHIVAGIGREILERLVARGAASKDWSSPHARLVFDEQHLKVVLIEMLEEAGVDVLTHVLATRPIMDGQIVKGAWVETKVGRLAVLAKVVVDCTGEADIASQTGCPMRQARGTATLAFKMANVDVDRLYQHFKKHPETFPMGCDGMRDFSTFELNWKEYGIFYFPMSGGRKWDIFQDAIAAGEYSKRRGRHFGLDMSCLIGLSHLGDVSVNSMLWRLDSLDPRDISQAELESQKVCYYVAQFFRTHVPGFEDSHVVQISQDMGIRISRGLEGETTLTAEMMTSPEAVHFDDVIGCRSARIRPLSGPNARVASEAEHLDHAYDNDAGTRISPSDRGHMDERGRFVRAHTVDIPYGIMLPRGVENLLVGSGKTVSCVPQELIRCGTSSMIPGQASGVAAALAARGGITPRALDRRTLQRELLAQGVLLGSGQRLRELGLE